MAFTECLTATVRMESGPDRFLTLVRYAESLNALNEPVSGRWRLRDDATGAWIPIEMIHTSERASRRSEVIAALEASLGFSIAISELWVWDRD